MVNKVFVLTSHRIIDRIDARLIRNRLNNRLNFVLKLLIVEPTHVGHQRRLSVLLILSRAVAEVHLLDLLGSCGHFSQLLLQTHLLLSKVLIGSKQVGVYIRIHVGIAFVPANLDCRRSEYLLRIRIHRGSIVRVEAILMAIWEASAGGRLWEATSGKVVLCVRISTTIQSSPLLELSSGG